MADEFERLGRGIARGPEQRGSIL